jgi:hypothetical protein
VEGSTAEMASAVRRLGVFQEGPLKDIHVSALSTSLLSHLYSKGNSNLHEEIKLELVKRGMGKY